MAAIKVTVLLLCIAIALGRQVKRQDEAPPSLFDEEARELYGEIEDFEDIEFEERGIEDDGLPLDQMITDAYQQATGYSMDQSETPFADGTVLEEGDMILTPEQVAEDALDKRAEAMGLGKRKGISNTRYRWENNVLPYVIESGTFNTGEMREINNAIADWNKYTCVTIKPRTNERYYITMQNGRGCSSYVGVIKRGSQAVNLARGCRVKRIILHELGHALGFQHEQCRYDRDDYLTIHINRVEESKRGNFNKRTTSQINTYDVPYDYSSVMQYGQYSFGGGQITIETKDPKYQELIGKSKGLSYADLKTMNAMYNCGSHCTGDCEGYYDKDCKCQCASGANNFVSGTSIIVPIKQCGSGDEGNEDCQASDDSIGQAYFGTIAITESGKTCQNWDAQSPHAHTRDDSGSSSSYWNNLGESSAKALNYCRNPDAESGGLWCYTTDINTRWEYCAVPTCAGSCYNSKKDCDGWAQKGYCSSSSRWSAYMMRSCRKSCRVC